MIHTRRNALKVSSAIFAILTTVGSALSTKTANAQAGAVFTTTNTATNSVRMFLRSANGALTAGAEYATGGTGGGGGLGSQGAVILSADNKWLFAVNAVSSDISVFSVQPNGITLTGRYPSGGSRPISPSISGNLLYVVNAGIPNNITGFTVSANGVLTAIPNSTQPLSANNANPGQIGFDPFGALLAVTEKGTNMISIFAVNAQGVASPRVSVQSIGSTPFGFGFDWLGRLYVSEAASASVSSYYISSFGILPISAIVGTLQAAPCWVAVSKGGNRLWTGNAGASRSVSAFSIAKNGTINLIESVAAGGLQGTTDLAIDASNRYLYALENTGGAVRGFRILPDGRLELIGSVGSFGAGFTGLAAY